MHVIRVWKSLNIFYKTKYIFPLTKCLFFSLLKWTFLPVLMYLSHIKLPSLLAAIPANEQRTGKMKRAEHKMENSKRITDSRTATEWIRFLPFVSFQFNSILMFLSVFHKIYSRARFKMRANIKFLHTSKIVYNIVGSRLTMRWIYQMLNVQCSYCCYMLLDPYGRQ